MTTNDRTPRPVVVGVDGSRDALEAVRLGAREAHRRGAPLELVLAFPWRAGTRVPAPPGFDGRAVLHTMAELALDTAVQVAAGVGTGPVSSRIIEGDPVDVLTRTTATARLLCVGTQGTGGAHDLLLGSTAAGVVRAASCPLLVVPSRPGTSVENRSGVVVGLQGEPADRVLLAEAFPAAEARGAELIAVHAWQHRVPGVAGPAVDPLVPVETALRREETALEDSLGGWPDRYPTVAVRRVVEHARAATTLIGAALTAELLVVGHRQRRFLDRLGSVTHAVLHRAACPVLIVPLDAAAVPGALPLGAREPVPVS